MSLGVLVCFGLLRCSGGLVAERVHYFFAPGLEVAINLKWTCGLPKADWCQIRRFVCTLSLNPPPPPACLGDWFVSVLGGVRGVCVCARVRARACCSLIILVLLLQICFVSYWSLL